jgi:hypothetical protein
MEPVKKIVKKWLYIKAISASSGQEPPYTIEHY